jgi:GntR family transcriptional regulator of vanillate catabolism
VRSARVTPKRYAAYATMNDRFHALILDACGNRALQGTVALDRDWMLYAHRQHHMLFDALKRGEGTRAQNLAIEHTEVAQMNMRLALERRAESEQVMPAIRLVVG